jgi:hypothetical protein
MKTQRYRLLTTLIVSALHRNEPHPKGTEWAPSNVIDVQEADALVQSGYAEKVTGDSKAPLASTVFEREDAARKRQEALDRGEDLEDTKPVTDADDVLWLILDGSVDDVTAELEGLTPEQLTRLAELEASADGKKRKGVADAVAQYLDAE